MAKDLGLKITIDGDARQAEKSLSSISKQLSNVGASANRIGNRLTIAFAAMSAGIGVFLKTSGNFEQWKIAFETMLGSAEKADALLKSITSFAKETPFTLPEVVEQTKKLLAYNIAQEDVLSVMESLGNIAAGVGREKLPFLTLAYGQVRSAQRLMGQELRQFTEAGVPLIDELGKQFGATGLEVKKMVSEGKVGFRDVEIAIKNLTTGNGKFADLMRKQSKTFLGTLANIQDSFIILSKNLGDALLPLAKEFATRIRILSERFAELDPDFIKDVANSILKLTLAVGGLAVAFKTLGITISIFTGFKTLTVGTASLIAVLNPLTLIIGGIIAAIVGVLSATNKLVNAFNVLKITAVGNISNIVSSFKLFFATMTRNKDGIKQANDEILENSKKTSKGIKDAWSEDTKGVLDSVLGSVKQMTVGFLDSHTKIKDSSEDSKEKQIEDGKKVATSVQESYFDMNERISKKSQTTFSDIFEQGVSFARDFDSALKGLFDDIFTNKEGKFAKEFTGALTGMFGIAGTFFGGFGGQLISQGLFELSESVFSSIFGGGKSFSELVEESFRKMVTNVNRTLLGIGKERTTLEKQVDVLEELKSTLGGEATVPTKFLENLGLAPGSTINEGLVNLLEDIKDTNKKELSVIQKSISDSQTKLNSVDELISKLRQVETLGEGQKKFEGFRSLQEFSTENLIPLIKFSVDAFGKINFSTKQVDAFVQGQKKFIQSQETKIASLSNFTLDELLDTIRLTNTIGGILGEIPKFATGSMGLQDDTLGMFNKGEIVIPNAFSEGIKQGKLTLGGGGSNNQGQQVTVKNTININGSEKSSMQLWQELRPFVNGEAIRSQNGSFSGIFEG